MVLIGGSFSSSITANDTLVRFKGAIGDIPLANVAGTPNLDGSFPDVIRNIVRGVNPAGQIWVISDFRADVKAELADARYHSRAPQETEPVCRQLAITSSPNEISVTVDDQRPLRTPAKGAPVAWVGPDGGRVNARMQLAFTSVNGRRVNDYTLSPDGRTLTMQVTETSLRLSQTITYKQVYRRDS